MLERSRDILINMLLAGAGGSLALAVSLFDNGSEKLFILWRAADIGLFVFPMFFC